MPRPEQRYVTFAIDGREVSAPEGIMLVDGAKYGDVEIPVFCYEPKLGAPVGACRMCLVEIEGIPKLQTACSTPVKDGMVVHTQTERVRGAQQGIVEFLLVNHPLDCPVCDKGGECPLQDITFGWGAGKSRFIEPKRHFKKPLELSPLIAIDRERCIICYRCVRFSQEISEDYQLVLLERGAHTYVGTFDGHPYVAPFSGNIIGLCPVGALTSTPYRFRARPWDVEEAGTVCTLCPAQCNITFTVRDDRVLRVSARDNDQVDDGWLCDKGRFGYQHVHADERITEPLVREGDELRPVSWERALDAAAALGKHKGRVGAVVGGQATNEEGFLAQRLLREGLGSEHIDCRAGGPPVPLGLARALADPVLAATVPDLEYAHTVLVLDTELVDDAPILDLRVRKGVRRRGVRLVTATSRPSSLDPNAEVALRFTPGGGGAFLQALDAALGELGRSDSGSPAEGAHDAEAPGTAGEADGRVAELASAAGAREDEVRAAAELLTSVGEDVVIVWGERLGRSGPDALRALLNVAGRLGLAGTAGAGLLEVPAHTNGRGLREAGCLPGVGPGYTHTTMGLNTTGIARAAAKGEHVTALYLLHTDPLRSSEHGTTWRAALGKAALVVAHASVLTEGIREYADVVFPAEAYAEKDGTLVHPDGRVQRVRKAIGRPGEVRAGWQVLADVARRVGLDLQVLTAPMATRQLFDAVPFYAGLTLDALAGHGVRWPESVAAAAFAPGEGGPFNLRTPAAAPASNGALRLGRYRSIWAAPEVEVSPALKFLSARQVAEVSPADAERLGLGHGQRIRVGSNGSRIDAEVHIRGDAPPGTVFLQEGTAAGGANALDGPLVELEPR